MSSYEAQVRRSTGDSSSSNGHVNRPVLSKLWKLKVPKKCIYPIWRLWHGSLAVGSKFRDRGMIVDASCSYCGEVETTEHLFLGCHFAKSVWDGIGDLLFVSSWDLAFKDLIIKVLTDCPSQACEIFVMTIWAIWRGRNEYRFNGKFQEASEIRNTGLNHLLWYKEANKVYGNNLFSEQYSKEKWKPPDRGVYMVNVDAAYPPYNRTQGLGAVIRNSRGAFFAGRYCRRWRSRSVLLAELMAVWMGMQLAKDLQLREIILQSDSSTVVKLLCDGNFGKLQGDEAFAEMGAIIKQCRVLSNSFNLVQFSFIHRSGNELAHLFAQKGLVEDDMSFYNVTPEWAKDTLDVDLLGMTAQAL